MKKGFTLIELLVVIAIISVLTTIVIVSLAQARCKGQALKAGYESCDKWQMAGSPESAGSKY